VAVQARSAALAFVTGLVACASAPPPPQQAPVVATEPEPPHVAVAGASTEPPPAPIATTDPAESSHPMSYDEALSKPEPVDMDDSHPHLSDVQLWSPLRGALNGCNVPKSAKITIKTAVQYGRAIGVTVDVRFERPRSAKPPKPAALKAERKATASIASCVDHNVRAVAWPPNRRRDSFTTEL
jgi:hypothetical protein